MEEVIGTRDPSGFAKVMLAHLQDLIHVSKSGTEKNLFIHFIQDMMYSASKLFSCQYKYSFISEFNKKNPDKSVH